MKNVYIYCEGQTEETFIREVLYPYFFGMEIYVRPIICTTKRTTAKKYKGGVRKYQKIRDELRMICMQHPNAYVTTMFDYYGMPEDTPGIGCAEPEVQKRIRKIEQDIDADLQQRNCHFHFMLHEFEGILFSKPESFSLIAGSDIVNSVRIIRESYPTPEDINNSPETAPSKRIEALIPNYAKVKNGALLAKDMGIDVIMAQCPHFREWVESIRKASPVC